MIDNENSRIVIGQGWRGRLDATPTADAPAVVVHPEDGGPDVTIPLALLEQRENGTFHLTLTRSEAAARSSSSDEQIVIPVIEEQLEIQKRMVDTGGVRITKTVHEREEQIDEPLSRETVEVARVAVDRAVDSASPPREEGSTLIIPIYEERLVVRKQLFLKEELHVTRQQTVDRHARGTVTLRREEVAVERQPVDVGSDVHPATSGDAV